ncbi:MAG TPA: glycosyltransferase family A protein [Gemmatimonadales bacterium]|nr:glycosyltransferase family A protein [Gemmatimonadales bacterium]
MSNRRWTITVLTIPGREAHLQQLLDSLRHDAARAVIHVVYNREIRDELAATEHRIRSWVSGTQVEVFFNNGDATIAGGRNFQLNLVKTPLVCFVDDDVTADAPLLEALESGLRRHPAAMLGLPSLREDTSERFKPRDSTPHIEDGTVRWVPVQGMLAASWTNLLRDLGGFNPRRRFWGEWTELNLRCWRHGLPTGYLMDGPHLRHWEDAPDSPTRNMSGRELHVLWGIICTALEYDAVDVNEATEAFWQLVEERYLSYSFGEELTPRAVLQATLSLIPELSAAWSEITSFREQTRQHPYPFAPFHAFERADLNRILPGARRRIAEYRRGVWQERQTMVGGLRRLVRKVVRRET